VGANEGMRLSPAGSSTRNLNRCKQGSESFSPKPNNGIVLASSYKTDRREAADVSGPSSPLRTCGLAARNAIGGKAHADESDGDAAGEEAKGAGRVGDAGGGADGGGGGVSNNVESGGGGQGGGRDGEEHEKDGDAGEEMRAGEDRVVKIRVRAKDGQGPERDYELKDTEPLKRVLEECLQHFEQQGVTPRYEFRWQEVKGTETPRELGMKDDDVIEASFEGGQVVQSGVTTGNGVQLELAKYKGSISEDAFEKYYKFKEAFQHADAEERQKESTRHIKVLSFHCTYHQTYSMSLSPRWTRNCIARTHVSGHYTVLSCHCTCHQMLSMSWSPPCTRSCLSLVSWRTSNVLHVLEPSLYSQLLVSYLCAHVHLREASTQTEPKRRTQ
jgi:hypothetical protein